MKKQNSTNAPKRSRNKRRILIATIIIIVVAISANYLSVWKLRDAGAIWSACYADTQVTEDELANRLETHEGKHYVFASDGTAVKFFTDGTEHSVPTNQWCKEGVDAYLNGTITEQSTLAAYYKFETRTNPLKAIGTTELKRIANAYFHYDGNNYTDLDNVALHDVLAALTAKKLS